VGTSKRLGVAAAIVAVCLMAGARPSAAPPTGGALLARYAGGDFDRVVSDLSAIKDLAPSYKDLKSNGEKWIEGGGADRERRRVAAATFALEAAHIGALTDWKEVRNFVRLENIYWRPPSQLLEWGCETMRAAPAPTPIEHTWQMAALAVVGRAQDYEFQVGSPWAGRANKGDEINHLEHAIARFPKDRRLLLAQGIAAETRLFPNARNSGLKEAQTIFANLIDDEAVGAEAALRLGISEARTNQPAIALPHLQKAAAASQDPFIVYLAELFAGQTLEKLGKPAEAEAAYQHALQLVPRGQSATFSIATLLAARGARAEASALIESSLAVPVAADPWKVYGDADHRFWPGLITELRKAIKP
jgi:tetratricopeptide (TPR) repeat protein